MLTADLLIAIAQVAVALAGFSGLIAAIRTAAPDGWHPRDIWSLSWMLGASIGALILALLPLWLALFGWSEDFVYRTSSAFAFFYIGTFVCVMAWAGRRLTLRGYPPRVPVFPVAIALLLGVAAAVAAAGAVGWLRGAVVPAYVGGLIALLVASALVLAVFLILLARLAQRRP
jgi:drug/metabolite transporter (DMT)-like permease